MVTRLVPPFSCIRNVDAKANIRPATHQSGPKEWSQIDETLTDELWSAAPHPLGNSDQSSSSRGSATPEPGLFASCVLSAIAKSMGQVSLLVVIIIVLLAGVDREASYPKRATRRKRGWSER